jgi:hypothetical protein
MTKVLDVMRLKCIAFTISKRCQILKLFCFLILTLSAINDVNAQSEWFQDSEFLLQPISIVAELRKLKNKQEFEITVYGRLKRGQYIYSTFTSGKDSPIPSRIFLIQPKAKKIEGINESETVLMFDEMFHKELKIHKNDFLISQSFKLLKFETLLPCKGLFKYQICTNKICSLPLQSSFLIGN